MQTNYYTNINYLILEATVGEYCGRDEEEERGEDDKPDEALQDDTSHSADPGGGGGTSNPSYSTAYSRSLAHSNLANITKRWTRLLGHLECNFIPGQEG